jgi:hypothetical protein
MKKLFYLSIISLIAGTAIIVMVTSGSGNDLASKPGTTADYSFSVKDGAGEFGLFCMDKSITHQNLRLIPICGNKTFIESRKRNCNYIPLKEALDKGLVTITEKVGYESIARAPGPDEARPNEFRGSNKVRVNDIQQDDNAEVNELVIENNSSDTVLIMGGEVVKGGKQDRMISQDVIISPNSGPIALSVFLCRARTLDHQGRRSARLR